MNARLSSLLVAGGVVLAGIQSGSLNGALPDAGAPAPIATLEGASLLSGSAQGLKLSIPGFAGVPRLQVLATPARIVVDLPGVNRGAKVTKKDLHGLACPQILRTRVAQFALAPQPVTRLVLEVVPGTQAEVACDGEGVSILLSAGQGPVQARLSAPAAPVIEPAPAPAAPETLVAAQAAPAPVVEAPKAAPAPAVEPVPVPEAPKVAAAPAVPEPVQAPEAPKVAAAPAAPEPAKTAPVAEAPKVAAAPAQDFVIIEHKPAAPAPEPAKLAALPAPAKAAPAPLAPLPSVGAPFQALPTVALQSALPALTQERPASARDIRAGRTLGDVSGRYTGSRMSIDVVGTDLTSFLRIIADTAHLNLVVDQDVQGIYTFKFTDTPWDQVLDVILKHAGLGKEVSNGVIRVAKIEKLQKEEEDRKKLEDAKALAGDLQTVSRPLSFAKAGEARGILEKMLTKRGSIIVDERTNTLIITDLPRNLPLLDDLIAQLDVQIQQVQIEARVVEASKNWDKEFGVKWPTSNQGANNLNIGGQDAVWVNHGGPSWNSINSRPSFDSNGNLLGNSTAVGYSPGAAGVTDISGAAGEFWVSFLSNRMSVNVILQALEKEGVVKIVSSPKVVTQNNKKAKILSGAKIPYPAQQTGAVTGAITVQFADANLELDVTPQITNDGTILMDIKVEKADADFGQLVGTTPTITRKAVETQVLVKDGGTAIMGGVYKNNNTSQTTGVPFLNKLPLIGFLFRNKINKDSNDELLIFITPRILKN